MDDEALGAWYRSLPGKRLGAGLLCRDGAGRVLLVKPTYKLGWEIPGGLVEPGESPRGAVAREAREELGLDITPGHLLVMDWVPAVGPRTDGLLLVYHGGTLADIEIAGIALPTEELSEHAFVVPSDLSSYVEPGFERRLLAALAALTSGRLQELEDGYVVA